ncbi:MAG: TonB C-terminal domain-containing protein [Victivallaceae bacterium]
MLNDPNRPYKLPQDNNPENRRRAFYLVIALAVVLTTIPLVFLVLRGWLSGEPAAEPTAQSQPLPATAPVTVEQPPPMVVETPVAVAAAPAIPATAMPEPGVAAAEPAILSGAAGSDSGVPASAGPAPAIETPVAAPAAAEPVVAPPPPPVAEPAVAPVEAPAVQPKPTTTPKKPTFTPLTAEERAKLGAANDRAKQSSTAAAKIVQPSADYKKKLYSFVRSQWLPPAASEIGNAKLKAAVLVEVAPDGTVKSAKLSRTSGNRKMDATVTTLTNRLKNRKAPAPGNGTVKVEVELLCE